MCMKFHLQFIGIFGISPFYSIFRIHLLPDLGLELSNNRNRDEPGETRQKEKFTCHARIIAVC